jgi:hypothetical protein
MRNQHLHYLPWLVHESKESRSPRWHISHWQSSFASYAGHLSNLSNQLEVERQGGTANKQAVLVSALASTVSCICFQQPRLSLVPIAIASQSGSPVAEWCFEPGGQGLGNQSNVVGCCCCASLSLCSSMYRPAPKMDLAVCSSPLCTVPGRSGGTLSVPSEGLHATCFQQLFALTLPYARTQPASHPTVVLPGETKAEGGCEYLKTAASRKLFRSHLPILMSPGPC